MGNNNTNKCKICGHTSFYAFSALLLNKYHVSYYDCTFCGFLQTEEPYWLEEAYSESINVSDTGYIKRNLFLSNYVSKLLRLTFPPQARYLDYAGGYGVFVRIMRDSGFDFYWADKYTENLFSKGFEFFNLDSSLNIDAITCFECFEHFERPLIEIEEILSISKNIIFSTKPLPHPIPKPNEWWYYGLNHGQHISFYSEKTFNFLAMKYRLNYIHIGELHLLVEKRISKFKINILRYNWYNLNRFLIKPLKSKTWEDYLSMNKRQSYQ